MAKDDYRKSIHREMDVLCVPSLDDAVLDMYTTFFLTYQ